MKHTNYVYIVLGILFLATAGFLGNSLNSLFTQSLSGDGEGKIIVRIDYGNDSLEYTTFLNENLTAFDALENVASVGYQEYDFGKLVTEINGIQQDSDHYWMFFINNESPAMGADSYILSTGDIVEFIYMDSNTAMNYLN